MTKDLFPNFVNVSPQTHGTDFKLGDLTKA